MHSSAALAFAATLTTALAAQQGFNYASGFSSGAPKQQSDFQTDFTNARSLAGTNGGFTDARLYTMIQQGTTSDVISAIPAALAVPGTHLLLGMWASGGQAGFDAELTALKSAIATYGSRLAGITSGIAVGSEDLYRESPIGIENHSNVGTDAATIVNFISQVRKALAGTALSSIPVGHVDTWTAWVNATNSPAVEASDFIGMDAYPYFQSTFNNPIENGENLFNQAYAATKDNAQGKPVWITETGWPVSGETENLGVPSIKNAKTYWDEVGCPLFGNTPVYWYTLQDADPTTPNPTFGVITAASTKPLYDLSCDDTTSSSSSSSSQPTSTGSGSASASLSATGSLLTFTTATPTGGYSSGNSTGGSPALSGGLAPSGTGSSSGSGSGSSSGSGSGASGSGSSSGSSGSGSAGSTGTGNVGPTPTHPAPFTGGSVANAGSLLSVFSALIGVAAFLF